MRFMMMIKANKDTEAGVMPGEKALAAMAKYNEELVKAGVMLDGVGLQASSKGARVRFSQGKPTVIDGPFAEAKELIAGFWMIQVRSKEEAIEWARRVPFDVDVHMGGEGEIELRRVFELEDFGPSEAIEHHRRIGEELASRQARITRITPYLSFDGRCREAFTFYAELLRGSIEMMMTHGESPMADQVPADWRDKIMHARLVIGGMELMGADSPPQYRTPKQGFSVSLGVEPAAEAERVFTALAEGGTVKMPLQPTFWAERFGMVIDRFGTPWMINCEKA